MTLHSKWKISVAVVIALSAVIAAWFLWPVQMPPVVRWANYITKSQLTSNNDSAVIRAALDTLLSKTTDAGR